MSYSRTMLRIRDVIGGATKGDTGILAGAVQQFRWYPTTVDTGQVATLVLSVLPDQSDTGRGWNFYSQASINLGAGLTKAPRQAMHGSDGAADPADTGAAFGVPVVGASDRLRCKVIPADTGVVVDGDLYVWMRID